jgi:hypothetical protein
VKCKFINDTDTEPSLLPESEAAKAVARPARNRETGEIRNDWYFPAGTELDHPDAWKMVNFGMATASDQECLDACQKITADEKSRRELAYQADAKGINEPADRDLFFRGVITGYERLPNGSLAYVPGPNWGDHAQKIEAEKAKEDDEL